MSYTEFGSLSEPNESKQESNKLWDAQMTFDQPGGATGLSTPEEGVSGQHLPSAYYDYETDKQFSHADAKLFYQTHRMYKQDNQNSQSALSNDENSPQILTHQVPPSNYGSTAVNHDPESTPSPSRADNTTETAHQSHTVKSPGRNNSRSTAPMSSVNFDGEAGPGSFANQDPVISLELVKICGKIQKILDLRHKYIRLSLQRPGDNPKDDSRWKIYPEPPRPVWSSESNPSKDQSTMQDDGLGWPPASEKINSSEPGQASKPPRKPGTDIGEDFDLNDLLPVPEMSEMVYHLDDSGVYQVYENADAADHHTPIIAVPTLRDYYMDLDTILSVSADGPAKSFAFRRLQYLEGKYNLYFLLHEYQEITDSKKVPHRDFYNVRKVDTHVHHSSCMNQKHLLRFIKSKMKKCPEEVVMFRDGKELSLKQVFESINLTAYDLSIDTLDMHAHTDSFHRFDKFNLKYNPVGESRLRTIFLKTDNYINGRYLAELSKEVISDLESSKYQMVEWRISIYGRSQDEWNKLANWVVQNKLFSHNVRWLIQVPRLYDVYKDAGTVENFEQIISNVFQPLFDVTQDPSCNRNLHVFLQRVVGFDSVDDESKPERRLYRKFPVPKVWNTAQSPPYSYWIYYLFANMTSLNAWRKQRGFNTFVLRPHCGEAGETDHLAAAVLCTHSINHGILLRKVPVLQYIFYLEQIGIAMSPLSNNALFLAYERNPFLNYFKRGLNVSLSTDDPLQLAFTKEPLIEEYSVAAQIYKLNAVDMCELAKNSVIQSGFEHALKKQWLGNKYHLPGIEGNSMVKSNIPDIRQAFRFDTLMEELSMINRYTMAGNPGNPVSSETLPVSAVDPANFQSPISPSVSLQTNQSADKLTSQDSLALRGSTMPISAQLETGHEDSHLMENIPPGSSLLTSQTNPIRTHPRARGKLSTLAGDTWLGGIQEPKNFPGLVQERTRRDTSYREDSNNGQD